MAQGRLRRPLRHPAGERFTSAAPSSAAASARKAILITGPQVLGILAARAGRPAGQAGAAPRPDVRPGRPSRADAASDCASAWMRDGRLTAIEHHAKIDDQQLRRFLRAGGQRLAHALCQPRDRDLARGGAASTPARRCSCARRARRPARSRSKARSTRRREACGIDPLEFRLQELRRGRADHPASRSRRRRCANATRKAPNASAGSERPLAPRQMRDDAGFLVGWGMGTAIFPALMFQAEARAVLRARRHRRWSRPARTTWARAPGPRSPRSPPTGSASTSTRSSSGPAPPTCPDAGIAGGSGAYRDRRQRDPQCRRRRDRQARRARHRRPSARRCSAPAMPASSRATAACSAATTKAAARAMPTSSRRAGLAEIEGTRQRRAPIRPRRRATPCTRTARSSPR